MTKKIVSLFSIFAMLFLATASDTLLHAQDDTANEGPLLTVKSLSGVLREAPANDAAILSREIRGLTLPITGVNVDGDFYQVMFEDQIGWISVVFVASIEGDLDSVAIIETDCFVRADQARFASVRVGFGINRTPVTFLEVDTEYEVLGQNSDDDAGLWFALDKNVAAPGKSIQGDVAWVAAVQVQSSGNCEALPIVEASGIIPFPVAGGTALTGEGVVSVSVPASAGWVDSGIAITQGQSFAVSASGTANTWADCSASPDHCASARAHGPAGFGEIASQSQYDLTTIPLRSARLGVLVARIGNGPLFVVGAGGTFTANATGNLFFVHNDLQAADSLADNSGAFTVIVKAQE